MIHQHRNHHGKQLENLMRLLGSSPEPKVLHPSGKERRHHCLLQDVGAILFTRSSSVLFLNAWSCRSQVKRSCRAVRTWSGSSQEYTTWVKTDPDVTLERHMVDVQKAVAEFREASARRHDTSSQEDHFDNNVPYRSPVQKKKTTQHLQLESRTSTWKRRCL